MDAQRVNDFTYHGINWILSAISHSLQLIGQVQVNKELSEDEKTDQVNVHKTLILNLCHFLAPYLDVAEEIFPQHKVLLEWVHNTFNEAINKNIIKACACKVCAPSQDIKS
jgi:hypothetical protein